jgi:hypothetical protein
VLKGVKYRCEASEVSEKIMSGTSLHAFSQSSSDVAEGFFQNNHHQEPRVGIAVVDARGLMRDSLVRYMTSERDFNVVGYSSVDEMLTNNVSKSHSLVIFGSASHANQSALDEITRLKSEYPECLMRGAQAFAMRRARHCADHIPCQFHFTGYQFCASRRQLCSG